MAGWKQKKITIAGWSRSICFAGSMVMEMLGTVYTWLQLPQTLDNLIKNIHPPQKNTPPPPQKKKTKKQKKNKI